MTAHAPFDKPVTIHDAKTNLSRLVAEAEAGREIVLARGTKPVAKLVPLEPVAPKERRLGWLAHEKPAGSGGILDNGFWDPLSDEEMGLSGGEAPSERRS
jgi:prevent-host-death family protein